MSRRLTGLNLSVAPQDLTLATFEGGAGGSADSPDIDIEDDGSFAWVAFRQDIGGRSRTVARRLRGSLYEDPFAIDGGQTSFGPRVDFAGKGIGGAVTAAAGDAVFSGYLDKFDAFQPAVRIDADAGRPAVARDRDLRARRRLRRLAHRPPARSRARAQGRREGLRARVRGLQPRLRRRRARADRDRGGPLGQHRRRDAPGRGRRPPAQRRRLRPRCRAARWS